MVFGRLILSIWAVSFLGGVYGIFLMSSAWLDSRAFSNWSAQTLEDLKKVVIPDLKPKSEAFCLVNKCDPHAKGETSGPHLELRNAMISALCIVRFQDGKLEDSCISRLREMYLKYKKSHSHVEYIGPLSQHPDVEQGRILLGIFGWVSVILIWIRWLFSGRKTSISPSRS